VGENVLGVLMPCYSRPEDAEMARLAAGAFGLETLTVDLAAAYDSMVGAFPVELTDMARANIKPRLRMAVLYALAQTRAYLVAGTGNASELMVGYFTKYGDGGVDVEPLGNLYKWQVRKLAADLGVPQPIIELPPSAGLWAGQTDEEELGITYKDLDATLDAIAEGTTVDVEPSLLAKVQRLIAVSAHKRAMPPMCPI
jgi:NAD+ synthase